MSQCNSNEKEEFVVSIPERNYAPNPKGLGWHLFEKMKLHENAIGQICGDTGLEATFGNMLRRAIRVAITIRNLKLSSEDLIVLCSHNQFNAVDACNGGLLAGVRISAIDPGFSQADSKYLLDMVRPKIVFVVPEEAHKIAAALKEIDSDAMVVVFGGSFSDEFVPFSYFLRNTPEEEARFQPTACANIQDTALILFSSGSTGYPKGICLSHFALLCQNCAESPSMDIRFGYFMCLYGVVGFSTLLMSITNGYPTVFFKHFSVKNFWYAVDLSKMVGSYMPPHLLLKLTQEPIPEGVNLSNFKYIMVGGSGISGHQIVEARKVLPGIVIIQSYGQTETAGPTINVPEKARWMEFLEKPGSVGVLLPGFSAKIVDDTTGKSLGPNQVGELRLKTRCLFNGYYKRDHSETLDADGWFKTGDLMYYDDDGYFYFTDRLKEMFKNKMTHIQPMVLEDIINKHTAVFNSVVIGVPHPEDGHWPMAVVQLKKVPEAKHVLEKDIADFYNTQVSHGKKLEGGVKFVDSFPLTVTGKIDRRKLKEIILEKFSK